MRLLVTGATGFLGRAIVAAGARAGHHVTAASRSGAAITGADALLATGDLADGLGALSMSDLFFASDAVINCAARVHVLARERRRDAEAAYQAMNAQVPVALATAARAAGVARFVQISSVAAIASRTPPGETFDDTTPPAPTTPYGRSKLAAERALGSLAGPDFTVISLRPPAIYGPGVRAFFAMLARAANAGVPLPLGAIRNHRSFAYVANVADAAIAACTMEEGGAYMVTDSEPVSTGALYRELLRVSGHSPSRCLACPAPLVRWPARAIMGGRADSLLGDAAFDGSRFRAASGWSPRHSQREALRATMASLAPSGTPQRRIALP